MQSLCTLRNHCRQWPRNTRYQADATPYLGRTSTGWIAPALPGALIRSPRRRGREVSGDIDAERLRGVQIDHQLELGGQLNRQVGRLLTLEDAIDVADGQPVVLGHVVPVGDRPPSATKKRCQKTAGSLWRAASAMMGRDEQPPLRLPSRLGRHCPDAR